MIVVRCTAKLLTRLGVDARSDVDTSTGLLGDWYATTLHVRHLYVLAVARATLLPIVVTGRDLRSFPERMTSTLAEVLEAYALPAETIARECAAMTPVRYARTDDRSTVGVLVEFGRLLEAELLARPTASPTALSLRLADTPIVARDAWPGQDTRRAFGAVDRSTR
jgi:hypothetical protein